MLGAHLNCIQADDAKISKAGGFSAVRSRVCPARELELEATSGIQSSA